MSRMANPLSSTRNKVIAAILVVVVAVVAVPFIYINFVKDDAPARLQVGGVAQDDDGGDGPAGGAAAVEDCEGGAIPAGGGSGDVSGTWAVGDGSCAGYRVEEVLFGQSTEGVGRTPDVTGTMTIDGTTVQSAELTVQMATMTSDEDRRDGQFRGRIMSVDEFPTSTFTLTSPIELGDLPAEGVQVTATATGDLTLRGVTRSVTFELTAVRQGANIVVSGATDLSFDEFGIPEVSNPAAQVGRTGTLELLVVFDRQ